jgi:5-methylcytosine-specific restriction endonuclease McrA
MNKLSWAKTVQQIHEHANYYCEYCRTFRSIIGQAMHVEHIEPNGNNEIDNLCLSCAICNLSKAKATNALDPETDKIVPLFNPRKQTWSEHFVWVDGGLRIKGLTPTGRATVLRLKMNIDRVVIARSFWIKTGNHPPPD